MVQHSQIDHTLLTTVSYASNSNSVASASAAGASTLVSRADHVHLGVRSISHTSNTFSGPITLVAEGSLGITSPTSGTLTLNAGASGAGSGNYQAGVWTTGTSMPGSPVTNQRITRTDLGMDFYYDGTRWLSTQVHRIELKQEDTVTWPLTANAAVVHRGNPPLNDAFDVWLMTWYWQSAVLTTNSGSAYWTVSLRKFPFPTGASVQVATANTSADTADSTYHKSTAINALLGAYGGFFTDSTKTSTPGNHRFIGGHITCRLVGT